MNPKNVILIGCGVRETYIAKRLYKDTNGTIVLTVITDKQNPEISEYAKNVFIIDDYKLSTFLSNKNVEHYINKNFIPLVY